MYVSRLRLYNWKNFQDIDVVLAERCFIIGANATGKSNFLDALRFLRDIAKQGGGLQSAVQARGGVTKIRCLSARTHTNIRVEVDLNKEGCSNPTWRYAIDFKHSGGGIQKSRATILEEVVFNYETQKFTLHRTPSSSKEDSETLMYTHLEQVTSNVDFREIRDSFQSIEYLNVIPQMVREASSIVLSSEKEDYFGRNFLIRLSALNPRVRNSYLRRINDVLSLAVPQLEQLSFVKDPMGIPHIEARYRHWRANGGKQNEMLFSDGTLRLIGFLFAMLDGTGIILLEEPESNLHSGIVTQIPEYIARIQRERKRQVIVTTHSYEILSSGGIGINELIVLSPSAEGTTATNATALSDVKNLLDAGLTAADVFLLRTAPNNVESINQL